VRIFGLSGFNEGSWVSGLAKLLRERPILTNKQLVSREWRGTLSQGLPALHWIQFEPPGYKLPAFWMGKPAIVAWDDVLYVGYYVERGYEAQVRPEYLRTHPEYIIDDAWHWHSFRSVLNDKNRRDQLHSLMENLPASRRCLTVYARRPSNPIPYTDRSSLAEMESAIAACDPNEWIDLILGASFTRDECLRLQTNIVDELRAPLIRAMEIDELVLGES
jgi:hypothetical protein